MSGLYNIIFGTNPLAGILLNIFGIDISICGRFRDFYLYKPGDDDMCALLVTRNGGPNRNEFNGENLILSKIRGYIFDEDAPIDNTYALFYYKIPKESAKPLGEILKEHPTLLVTKSFDERWEDMLDSMRGGTPDANAQRGIESITPVVEQIVDALKDSIHISVLDGDK